MAERCLRTQFISLMSAPLAEQRAVDRLLVLERQPWRRQASAAPSRRRRSGEHEIVLAEALDHLEDAPGRRLGLLASGTGWAASTISMRSHGTAWP